MQKACQGGGKGFKKSRQCKASQVNPSGQGGSKGDHQREKKGLGKSAGGIRGKHQQKWDQEKKNLIQGTSGKGGERDISKEKPQIMFKGSGLSKGRGKSMFFKKKREVTKTTEPHKPHAPHATRGGVELHSMGGGLQIRGQ